MSFLARERLRSLLRSPATLGRIVWIGTRGFTLRGRHVVSDRQGAFVFHSPDLPADYDRPDYVSSNPYQKRSLELIDRHAGGLVVDLGAGSPKHGFPNVCQIEIRQYPGTDIVVTEGRVPLRSGSADAVVSEAVLEHVQDPFRHVAEIFRILKPGGEVLLDAAFLQPLHAFPHHYFNTSASALRRIFAAFEVEELRVGPHQHPWIALNWILGSYHRGLRSSDDRERFAGLTVGRVMELLSRHQELRDRIKAHDDPRWVADRLLRFNAEHRDSLGPFVELTPAAEEELAAGFQVYARKPPPRG